MPRIFIYCSSNSNFSFIEKYISNNNSNSYTNVITEIYLEENSNIEYLKLQSESKSSMSLISFVNESILPTSKMFLTTFRNAITYSTWT